MQDREGDFQPTRRTTAEQPAMVEAHRALMRSWPSVEELEQAHKGLVDLLDGILDGSKNRRLETLEQAAGRLERAREVLSRMQEVHTAIVEAYS